MEPSDPTSSALLNAAREARRNGDALRCYDLASRLLIQGPHLREAAYLASLALADLGNLDLAFQLYERHDNTLHPADEDWLALRGRLHKEMALREQPPRLDLLSRSAAAYEAAYRKTGKPYSGVNAASMALLAGAHEHAERLAREVLAALSDPPPANEFDAYFQHATRAEAALILGDLEAAGEELGRADRYLPRDATARSRTVRQLCLVLDKRGLDEAVLAPLQLPDFVCILGDKGLKEGWWQEVALDAARVATAFVVPESLAALRAAEALANNGAALHLILPCAREEASTFFERQLGAEGGKLCERLLEGAHDITPVTGFVHGEEARALLYARQVAAGLVRLRGVQTGATSHVLVARAGEHGLQLHALHHVEPAAHSRTWPYTQEQPRPMELERQHAAFVYAEMSGYSRLRDAELPSYWNQFMPELARALSVHSSHVLLQSTWGDGLFLVIERASAAASAALTILSTVLRVRERMPGALARLNVRVSIHYAPVYTGWDPVSLSRLYYGGHVSVAAQFEPLTPPGTIFVTEEFAAQLSLEGYGDCELIYAGEVDLAKRAERRRMFHLRSRATPAAEAATPMLPGEACGSDEVNIGCTGSLLLSDEEQAWVRQALREDVLPEIRRRYSSKALRLSMGLAPGADVLFACTAREWCRDQGIPSSIHSVLPLPPDVLLRDWNERAASEGLADLEESTRGHWAMMCRVLAQSGAVIHLWPAEAGIAELASKAFRQLQYQRLGAHLVKHADVLIAIYNSQVCGAAGGAAEVARWRGDPSQIPLPLTGGAGGRLPVRPLVHLDLATRTISWIGDMPSSAAMPA